jgi:hypothetical protein
VEDPNSTDDDIIADEV